MQHTACLTSVLLGMRGELATRTRLHKFPGQASTPKLLSAANADVAFGHQWCAPRPRAHQLKQLHRVALLAALKNTSIIMR